MLNPAIAPPRPLVFAHRGGRALGPENTIPAFDAGIAAGADGLELDVHVSRDGVAVVHHDPELDRCTDARGPIAARTAAELRAVHAAHHFAPDAGYPWRAQEVCVPTLADVLERYPEVPVIIEIKATTPGAAESVVAAISGARAQPRVCVGSFCDETQRAVRALDPSILTSAALNEARRALYRTWARLGIGRAAYRAFQVPEVAGRLRVVTPRFVRAVHRGGCCVQVWTVNDEADMWRLLDWGVDGLITDHPDRAVRVRDAWAQTRATTART